MATMNDDLDAAYDALRPWLALYIGGMGAKGKNFYHDYTTRLGYGDEADRIQDLYLSGKKAEAEALVPKELLDAVALYGPAERISERLAPGRKPASAARWAPCCWACTTRRSWNCLPRKCFSGCSR